MLDTGENYVSSTSLPQKHASERAFVGAVHKINHVLHVLGDCLVELEEVEEMMGPETKGEETLGNLNLSIHAGEEMSDVLRIASAMREMVSRVLADIQAVPGIQDVYEESKTGVHLLIPAPSEQVSKESHMALKNITLLTDTASQIGAKEVCAAGSEIKRRKTVSVEGQVTCGHTCEHHPEVMDPLLWSNLSEDLMQLVFARLPMPEINRLRLLSKAWRSLLSTNSSFTRICARLHPKMFALASIKRYRNSCSLTMYDVESYKWHDFELRNLPVKYRGSRIAGDGGLVCFVPRQGDTHKLDDEQLPILVCNPLTNEWRKLPLQVLVRDKPRMVQFVMDRHSKYYKLILVGQIVSGGGFVAEVYDSCTDMWSRMDSGFIFGVDYRWSMDLYFLRSGVGVYDCTKGQLSGPELEETCLDYTVFKDRVFVLEDNEGEDGWEEEEEGEIEYLNERGIPDTMYPDYLILDIAVDTSTLDMDAHHVYKCSLRTLPDEYRKRIFACHGFLLVVAENCLEFEDCHQIMRLYDMSKDEWRVLPRLEESDVNLGGEFDSYCMCELQWDARP